MAENKNKNEEKSKEKEQVLNFQNDFLNTAKKEGKELTFYLINGLPIKAKVIGFDNFTVLVEKEGKKRLLLYKHAISTISE